MENIRQSKDLFQNIYKNRAKVDLIIDQIKKELIKLLGDMGIFVAISDVDGNIKHIDNELDEYYEYIQEYCQSNMKALKNRLFSIPLKNLIFFKISERVVVVLSTKKLKIKRLVTFIVKMDKYSHILNHLIDKIKTINYWNSHDSTITLFKAFQEQIDTKEVNNLFKLVEKSLDKFEFEKTLTILNTIKNIYQKHDKHSLTCSYIDKVIKKIESRLKARKDLT